MSNPFRQDTGVVHGLVHPALNYDGSQLHAESIQFGGHNSLSHPAVSSNSAKQEKEPDTDEQQKVTFGKINHGTSGELGCSVPLVARQGELPNEIQRCAYLLKNDLAEQLPKTL